MKKLLFTMMAIIALFHLEASRPNTYDVDDRGSVSVGASKLGQMDSKVSDFQLRKPERHEITDIVPPSMSRSINSFFSW